MKEEQQWRLKPLGSFVVSLKDKINKLAQTDSLPENQATPFDFGSLDYKTVSDKASLRYARVQVQIGGKDVEVICLPDGVSASDRAMSSRSRRPS